MRMAAVDTEVATRFVMYVLVFRIHWAFLALALCQTTSGPALPSRMSIA